MVRGPEAERILTVPVRPPMGHTMFHLCVCVCVWGRGGRQVERPGGVHVNTLRFDAGARRGKIKLVQQRRCHPRRAAMEVLIFWLICYTLFEVNRA